MESSKAEALEFGKWVTNSWWTWRERIQKWVNLDKYQEITDEELWSLYEKSKPVKVLEG